MRALERPRREADPNPVWPLHCSDQLRGPAPGGSATRRIVPGRAGEPYTYHDCSSSSVAKKDIERSSETGQKPCERRADRVGFDEDGRPCRRKQGGRKTPISRGLGRGESARFPEVMATTALWGATEPAAPVSVTSPSAVGEEMLISAALGGSSGTNGVGSRLDRQHELCPTSCLTADLQPAAGLPEWERPGVTVTRYTAGATRS